MSVSVDRRAYTELSTAEVPAQDAFAYWREAISATIVRLTAEPVGEARFRGRLEHVPCGDIALTTVTAGSKRVRRTRTMIGKGDEEFLLVSVQLDGTARIEQDGRTATLTAGTMAFGDSTRPYAVHFDAPHSQLVVQVPKQGINVPDTRRLTARTLGHGTPGAAVSAFLTSLSELARTAPGQAALLVPHAVGLLSAAASFAAMTEPTPLAGEALLRQRITEFLHRNLADARLDAETVARTFNVSRRSLYRVAGGEGVAAQLRRIRIERARQLLVDNPGRPVGSVAAACGFDSESGFHRAFRDATGQTPGDYRQATLRIGEELGTPGQRPWHDGSVAAAADQTQ